MNYSQQQNWRKMPATIKFEHLNPALQEIIGKPGSGSIIRSMFLSKFSTIRDERKARATLEVLSLLNLQSLFSLPPARVRGVIGFAFGAVGRTAAALCVQKKHRKLVERMKEFGILQTKFERNYPYDWINPTIVSNTHPVFFVDRKGDLVFLKNNRWEYARYLFQKGFAGKLGLNLWRWRVYLEPPEAPQPIREWAKQQAAKWAERLVPKRKPAFGIVQAAKPSYAKKTFDRRLHYAK